MSIRSAFTGVGVALSVAILRLLSSPATAAGCVGVNFVEGTDASAREAACLHDLRSSASRKDNVLTLRLANDATRTWRSNPKACAEDDAQACAWSSLIGYQPAARVYAVLTQYYEGASVDIVSAVDGQTLSVHGIPYFSPNGAVFVVLNNDMENGSDFDVAVGSTSARPASLVWKMSSRSAIHWQFTRWVDNDRAILRGTPEGLEAKCELASCDYVVARSASGWTMTPPRPSANSP